MSEFLLILKPSQTEGIGVFAVYDMPIGVRVFSRTSSPRKMKTKDIPAEFRRYCIFLNDEDCWCPEQFDRMEIGWYLNHSATPNITKNSENQLVTMRAIQAGEELLMDYNILDEPEHLKEAYYKESV